MCILSDVFPIRCESRDQCFAQPLQLWCCPAVTGNGWFGRHGDSCCQICFCSESVHKNKTKGAKLNVFVLSWNLHLAVDLQNPTDNKGSVHMYTYMQTHTQAHTHTHINTHRHIRAHTHTHTHMYTHMYTHMPSLKTETRYLTPKGRAFLRNNQTTLDFPPDILVVLFSSAVSSTYKMFLSLTPSLP